MNLEDMKYISASSSSLGVGSDMTKEDLMFFTDGLKSQNFPFGKTEDDFIKFSVYNFDNTLVTESMIYPSGSYRNYTQSYYDPTNRYITYSYSKFDGTAPILLVSFSLLVNP